jgi:hypothetical protein
LCNFSIFAAGFWGKLGQSLGQMRIFGARGKMTNVDLQALMQTHFGENSCFFVFGAKPCANLPQTPRNARGGKEKARGGKG